MDMQRFLIVVALIFATYLVAFVLSNVIWWLVPRVLRSLRALSVVVIVSLMVTTIAIVPPAHAFTAWSDGRCLGPEEVEMLGYVNDYRAANNLNRLYASDSLAAAADYHSLDMATYLYLSHNLSGSDHIIGTADDYTWSVNITNFGYPTGGWRGEAAAARDYRATTLEQFQAFTLSPDHNALLLDPSAKAIGPGFAQNDGDTFAQKFWILDFGDYTNVTPAVSCDGGPVQTPMPSPTPQPTNTPTATKTPTPTKTPKPCHGNSCH